MSTKKFHDRQTAMRRMRRSGARVLMLALMILAIVSVNILMRRLEERFALTLDLSDNRQYSISETTKKAIAALDEPIHIYTLFSQNSDARYSLMINEFLSHVQKAGNVTVSNLDIAANPAAAARFDTENRKATLNAVVVTNAEENRFRVLNASELFEYEIDRETQNYSRYDFVGEQALVSAIAYVTGSREQRVYLLGGHDGLTYHQIPAAMRMLEAQNYVIEDLNLANAETVLRPGDIVMIAAPQKDISEDEYLLLKAFLAEGGRIFYAGGYETSPQKKLNALFALYGVSVEEGLVVEDVGTVEKYYRNPMYLMPTIVKKDENGDALDVTAGFEGSDYIVLPQSVRVEISPMRQESVRQLPFLMTSQSAYVKTGMNDDSSIERDPTDLTGRMNIAVALVKTPENPLQNDTRIVLIGNAYFLTDSMVSAFSDGKLLLSSMNWLAEKEEEIYIVGKSMGTQRLDIPDNGRYIMISALVIGGLPCVIFLLGAAIWIKRRHL